MVSELIRHNFIPRWLEIEKEPASARKHGGRLSPNPGFRFAVCAPCYFSPFLRQKATKPSTKALFSGVSMDWK